MQVLLNRILLASIRFLHGDEDMHIPDLER